MDHIGIPVSDASATKTFYLACLAPLGWRLRGFQEGRYVGFDKPDNAVLYFVVAPVAGSVHLAFKAENHMEVQAFYAAALSVGGVDNGLPGPRPDYGPAYFAAFAIDPDGHNIEAVFGGAGPARLGAVSQT